MEQAGSRKGDREGLKSRTATRPVSWSGVGVSPSKASSLGVNVTAVAPALTATEAKSPCLPSYPATSLDGAGIYEKRGHGFVHVQFALTAPPDPQQPSGLEKMEKIPQPQFPFPMSLCLLSHGNSYLTLLTLNYFCLESDGSKTQRMLC